MSGGWPDGWIPALLKDAGLPVTGFTSKAILTWQQSTPMLPYTNNPLGMPASPGKTLELMRTGYAMFATMKDMRAAFSEFVNSQAGQDVHDALALNEKYSRVWRAVHSLTWPASVTETDWPSAVLDMTLDAYRQKVQTAATPADRKTSGAYGTQTALGDLSVVAGRKSAQSATALQRATQAASQIPGRMK